MENKVIATVNGIDITDEILDTTIQSLAPERRGYFENEYGRKQLLDQLISVELINAFGTELGLDNDPQYMSQVEQALKDIKYSFTMNKILSTITIEEDEAKEVYAAHPERYQGQESIKASHILVDEEAMAKDLITKIEGGEISFEDAAREYSSCPSSQQGGDLGEFGRGMMVKEFEDAAFAMEAGEMTKEPVQTQFGYHVIKTTDKKGSEPLSFEEVKSEVMNRMLQDKQMEYYTKLITELQEKFPVTYHK
jgi:peptidyl-prolyl cis-trans isomerase C